MSSVPDMTRPQAGVRRAIDTDPHPVFSVYSAANFAEVAPERLSIVSWSLVGPSQERGMRALGARLWPGATWYQGSLFAFVGYFGCRPYHNLSGLCHMAEQVPQLTAAHFNDSYFEGAPAPPRVKGLFEGRVRRYAAVPRLIRELARVRPRLTELQGELVELEGLARAALRRGGAFALGESLARARGTLDDAWGAHMAVTASLPALRALQRSLGRRATRFWDELEPWVNRPSDVVWNSLRAAAELDDELDLGPAEFLRAPFYEVVNDREPWAAYTSRRDLSPVSADERRAMSDPGSAFWTMPAQGRSPLLRALANAVSDTMANRELSKSLAMRAMHVMRRLLPAAAAAQGIADDDWPYLTVGEIAAAHRERELPARAAGRRFECEAALALPMPNKLDFSAAPATRSGAHEDERPRGRGVSAGTATGRVVGPDLSGDTGEPLVLVAEALDAGIENLLPHVQGVVTAKGSLLSHIAILVREHGLPAVVGHPLSRELRPGDMVRLDGSSGHVERVDG